MRKLKTLILASVLLAAAPAALAQTPDTGSFAKIDALRMDAEYEQVFDLLQQRKASGDSSAELLWRLAQTHVDIGELAGSEEVSVSHYKKAAELAEAAVEKAPTNAMAHYTMGVAAGRLALSSGTQTKIELSREIKKHVDRAIELDPTLDMAYHVRGRWHFGVADLGWFTQAIVKVVYGGMPDASFEQAASDFRRAIQLNDRVVHRVQLAETYLKLGQEAKARAQLQRAIEMPLDMEEARKYKVEARRMLQELS